MSRGVSTFLLLVVIAGFGVMLWRNAAPTAPLLSALPTQAAPTENPNTISQLLQANFGQNSTPLPTIALPTESSLPTLPPIQAALIASPISAEALTSNEPTVAPLVIATPTVPPEAVATSQGAEAVEVAAVTTNQERWSLPPLIPPISRDPLGRDHYWFMRPVDSDANNAVLSYYSYGSDGPDPSNPLRVHHGVDMPNPIGEPVRAAGSGVIVWAADGRQGETAIFQNSPSYGNVIVIEHDFGYQGKKLWTLYAHLSAAFVRQGDVVAAGQVIGQVGGTGNVTNPHLHFEVRLGAADSDNRYANTYNPILWMVPYVGHGVIAGRVTDRDGTIVMDAGITIRNRANGTTIRTTTSYVLLDNGFDVNSDPLWQENFAVADIPVGRYDVIADIYGERVIRQVQVLEGVTSFVEISPVNPIDLTATPQSGG
jgi:murein DD-endopeptidase MepM/ murein hydrolase activator NlpD